MSDSQLPGKISPKQTRALRRAASSTTVTSSESKRDDLAAPTSRREKRPNYGICLSGGGIRAASFSLGVLQRMEEEHMLRGPGGARHLSCVSGGAYMATAFVSLERGVVPGEADPPNDSQTLSPSDSMPAYAPMSPEVAYLRDNTKYLAHGWGGVPVALWRLLMGIAWNFSLLILGVLAIAVPLGWIYGWILVPLRSDAPSSQIAQSSIAFPDYVFVVPVALACAGLLVGFVWVGALWTKVWLRNTLAAISLGLLGLAALWLVVVVVAPITLEWIRHTFEAVHTPSTPATASTSGAGSAAAASASTAAATLLLSTLTALFGARAVHTADSWWDQLSSDQRSQLLKKAWHLVLNYRTPLLNLLALLSGPATILALLVFGMDIGALYPAGVGHGTYAPLPALCFAGGMAILVLLWLFADLSAWSLHPFYRERLSNAFFLRRFKLVGTSWSPTATTDGDDRVDAAPRPYDFEYKISEMQCDDMPELVVCAAANVSRYGASPTGAAVTSFVFSESEIGGPVVGAWSADHYEQVLDPVASWRRTITLPGAMAMSGAAVSPEMGRMTRRPLRFLLTMANIRLGVWIPNPMRLDEFALRAGQRGDRLRLRPRIGYLLREMFGLDDPESLFLYVTDGGHYENLGLVELIRRRCEYIWCVDASGDKEETFSTLAGAVRLARDELNVEIKISPETMAPNPDTTAERAKQHLRPVVASTFCQGTVHYPEDENGRALVGTLVVIKAGVPEDAPLGIATFYENNPAFPCDSTLHQLYTADRFDAYRELGYFEADQALSHLQTSFEAFRN